MEANKSGFGLIAPDFRVGIVQAQVGHVPQHMALAALRHRLSRVLSCLAPKQFAYGPVAVTSSVDCDNALSLILELPPTRHAVVVSGIQIPGIAFSAPLDPC
jgi:hypothetical protein